MQSGGGGGGGAGGGIGVGNNSLFNEGLYHNVSIKLFIIVFSTEPFCGKFNELWFKFIIDKEFKERGPTCKKIKNHMANL